MPNSGKHNVNNIDSFFKVRPSRTTIREGETISFLEKGKLVKQEKRNGVVYETIYVEQGTQETKSTTTTTSTSSSGDITSVTAGTGLSGGGVSGPVTLNIDSTVATLTGTQTLTNKTLTAPTFTGTAQGASLTLTGDLTVQGDTTTLNTATLQVEDKNIVLNYHASNDTSSSAEGAGITIQDAVDASTDATILWDQVPGEFDFSHAINVTGNISVSGTVDGVDIAARDHDEVSLSGSLDYLTISGQTITRNAINLGTDVTSQLPLSNGGTGATNAITARENLGLEIGLDVQAYDAGLLSIAGLTTAANKMIYTTASDTYAVTDLTSTARTLLDDTSTTAMRTTLGVDAAGTDNSTDVTIAAGKDYITINESTQVITLGTIDIGDDTNLVGGTGITLTGDTLSTTDSEIVHDNLNGYVENEHKDHSSISITAGAGLSGGGDITASRGLALDISSLDAQTPALTLSDKVAIYDTDVSENNVATLTQLKAIVNTDTNTNQLTTFDVSGDSGTDQTISHGNTLTISGGNGITTSTSATDILSVALGGFSSLTSQSSPAEQDLVVIEEAIGGAIKKVQVGALTSSGISFNGSTANGLLTYGNSTTADVESNLTFSSGVLSIDNDDVNEGGQISLLPGTGHTSTYHIDNFYGHLRFFSSATAGEQFRLTSTGNLAQLTGTKHYFNGDGGNTYIDEVASGQLRLVAGGTEAMKFYSSGAIDMYGGSTTSRSINIGANRSGNGYSWIDLVGDATYTNYGARFIRNNGGANTSSEIIHRGTGVLALKAYDAGSVRFYTSNTERVRIDSSGNMSLGNVAPGSILHLGTGNTSRHIKVSDSRAMFGYNGSNAVVQGGNTKGIQFHTNTDTFSGSAKMTITSAGNVGIGVANPDSPLHLANNVATSAGFDSFADYQILLHDTGTSTTSYGMGIRGNTFMFNSDRDFEWRSDNSAKMFLDGANGRLGIGVTSPSRPLQIGTTTTNGEAIKLDGNASYGATIYYSRGGGYNWNAGVGGASSSSSNIPASYWGIEDVSQSNAVRLAIAHTTGNVGIGVTNPAQKLQVNGRTRANSFDVVDSNAVIYRNSNDLEIITYGGYDINLMPAGNVGIGDDNPPNKLSVKGSSTDLLYLEGDGITSTSIIQSGSGGSTRLRSANGSFQIYTGGANNSSSASGASQYFMVENDGDIRLQMPDDKRVYFGVNNSASFRTSSAGYNLWDSSEGALYLRNTISNANIYIGINDGGTTRYPVTVHGSSGGNFGIHNTSPKRQIDINSLDSNSRLRFTNTSTGTGDGTDGLEVGMEGLNAIFWNRESGMARIATANTERIRFKSDGKVGINGDTTDAFLRLNSTSSQHAFKIIGSAARASGRYALQIDDNDTNGRGTMVIENASGDGLKITTQGQYTGLELVANNDGSNPAKTCHIEMTSYEARANGIFHYDANYSGEEWFSGTMYAGAFNNWIVGYDASGGQGEYVANAKLLVDHNGNVHADADVVAFSTTTGSDRRLKKNIKDLPYGLDDILKLRAVEFDWKEKRGGKHDIGVIAQEIQEVIPEVVNEVKTIGKSSEELESHLSVDYGKIVSVLIKAVQEQQEQINKLEEKLNG
jgi:hypothetical protein